MPPETFTWDRKELLRDRKHERSSEPHHYSHLPHAHPHQHQLNRGGGVYGGVGGINGGGTRWREQQHLPSNPHHPYGHPSPRWISDGRGRAGQPGYGKQGGRHFHPEEEGNGFVPSRSIDKPSVDENFRASASGKFSKINRESRSSVGQKELKGQYTEAAPSPIVSERPNGVTDQPKLVVEVPSSDSVSPHADPADLHNQLHPEKQSEKNDIINGVVGDPLKSQKENLPGPVDWKSIKWTRSGSLPSRGPSLIHSNISRSMGSLSNDIKDEAHQTKVSRIQSSSCDAANGIAVPPAFFESLSSPSEETSSRKKPRLGWGEGLAKYEKKKVVGVDDCEIRNGLVCGNKAEQLPLDSPNSVVESPVNALSECATPSPSADCTSPAPSAGCRTPAPSSAVGFSCPPETGEGRGVEPFGPIPPNQTRGDRLRLPQTAPDNWDAQRLDPNSGIEEKESIKAGGFGHEAANFSVPPSTVSQNHVEESTFNLENLDLHSIACLNSAINKLLQSDVQSLGDSGYVRSTAMNKLSVWKGEVLKALEITESEIDNLEGQLKTMPELGDTCLQRSASSSLSSSYPPKPFGNHDMAAGIVQHPAPLNIAAGGCSDVHETPNTLEFQDVNVKGEDIESPGSATSKLVEVPFSKKDVSPSKQDNRVENSSKTEINAECSTEIVNDHVECNALQIVVSDLSTNFSDRNLPFSGEDKLHGSIWASNRETANGAAEELNKLLPSKQATFDIHVAAGISCVEESSEIIKAKLLRRKRFQQFKERVIALKFNVLQHYWKEDIRLLSSKKFRVKSHKKLDHSSRALQNGHHKYHLSLRTGFSSAGKLSLTMPNAKMIKYVRKLISNSQLKPLRPALKMPPLILDNKDKVMRFVSSNGMVEDPLAVEKERSMVNYWTEEERRIFMDNLAEYGKDFTKIASFLTHKTTADCVEFYYKNHKSDFFQKAKKHPDSAKQGKICPTDNYLVTSEKRSIREANAASLDILGAASEIAANAEECVKSQQKIASRNILGTSSSSHLLFGSSSLDVDDNERETVAADVLAGICSSLSSDAMGSCVTGTVENGEVYHEPPPYQRTWSSSWQLLEPEVTQDVDETCSDDSCKETDLIDWTDEEKSAFMQAVLSNGNDFDMISKCVHTRSRDQCKIFFSKARTCLALEAICSGGDHVVETDNANVAANDVGSYACVEADSDTSDEKLVLNIEKDSPSPDSQLNTECDAVHLSSAEPDLNSLEQNDVITSNLEPIEPDSGAVAEKPVLDMEVSLPPPDLNSMTEQDEAHLSTAEPVLKRLEVNDDATSDLEPMDAKYQSGQTIIDSQVEKLDQGVDNEDKVCQINEPVVKLDQGVDSEDKVCQSSEPVAVQDKDTPKISSGIEAAVHVGEEASNVCDIPDNPHASYSMVQESLVSEMRMSSDSNKDDGNLTVANHACTVNDARLKLCVTDDGHTQVADIPSSDRGDLRGNLQKVGGGVESGSSEKPRVITLQENNYPVPVNMVSHLSPAINWKTSEEGMVIANDVSIRGQQGNNHLSRSGGQQRLSGWSLLGNVESQIHNGYATQGTNFRDVNSLQSIRLLDMNFRHDQHLARNGLLQNGSGGGIKQLSSAAELPFRSSIEQNRNPCSQLDGSLGVVEKPRTSGKVKLFGQILTKPCNNQKPSPVVQQQNGVNENHQRVARPFSIIRPSEDQPIVGGYSAAWTKLDGSSSSSRVTDNAQVTTYGFWDGSRIQTGFSSLPNTTAVLMAKYPDGFGNNSLPSKMDHLQSHVVNNGRTLNFNGLSILPARPTDYQVHRTVARPLAALSLQQRQDMLLSELQRRNRIETVSVVQQTARGIVVGGGQCSGVSDPVAAIRMQYGSSEQFNGQTANIIANDEPWRGGQGNVGL